MVRFRPVEVGFRLQNQCQIPPQNQRHMSDSDSKFKVRFGVENHGQVLHRNINSGCGHCQILSIFSARIHSAVGSVLALICAGTSRADGELGGPLWQVLLCSRPQPRSVHLRLRKIALCPQRRAYISNESCQCPGHRENVRRRCDQFPTNISTPQAAGHVD